jgi:hypothetical protein
MGINFDDAEGIDPNLLQQAKDGEAAMKNVKKVSDPIIAPESIKKGSPTNQRSFNDIMASADANMSQVCGVVKQGGFTGEARDKSDLLDAYNDWVRARNVYNQCPDKIVKTSVRYTTLVNGKADQNQIITAHQEQKQTKETCDKAAADLIRSANKYIETDRRVKENWMKEQQTFPVETTQTKIENFQVRGGTSVIEGFDFDKEHQPLPRYDRSATTTIPWNEYYTICGNDAFCENAHQIKDQYVATVNTLFKKAEEKLVLYKTLIDQKKSQESGTLRGQSTLNNLLDGNNGEVVNTVIQNQKKEIDLYKQQALYDYDKYNSLSFIQDTVIFIYYAVFAIFVYMSIRDFYSYGTYDKRNILILILLGIYPKYILNVVLWVLNILNRLAHMLGLKNVSFWY